MASQLWIEFVPITERASFWMRKFSSIVRRADASTPTAWGEWRSITPFSPVAATSSACSHVVACSSPSSRCA